MIARGGQRAKGRVMRWQFARSQGEGSLSKRERKRGKAKEERERWKIVTNSRRSRKEKKGSDDGRSHEFSYSIYVSWRPQTCGGIDIFPASFNPINTDEGRARSEHRVAVPARYAPSRRKRRGESAEKRKKQEGVATRIRTGPADDREKKNGRRSNMRMKCIHARARFNREKLQRPIRLARRVASEPGYAAANRRRPRARQGNVVVRAIVVRASVAPSQSTYLPAISVSGYRYSSRHPPFFPATDWLDARCSRTGSYSPGARICTAATRDATSVRPNTCACRYRLRIFAPGRTMDRPSTSNVGDWLEHSTRCKMAGRDLTDPL